jgi:hypothetical protein
MDTQVMRAAVFGMANPFTGKQAPDHQVRGYTTQDKLEGELKYNPDAKSYPRFKPSNVMKPLPEFAFGVQPTFSRQEGAVEDRLRQNISLPDVYTTGRVLSGDLVEMYAKIEAKHRDVPGPLSGDYQGSPYMYGALYGLPLSHPTNGGNFIAEYGEALSDQEWHRRTQKLVDEGYDAKHVAEMMKEHIGDQIKKRLSTR